MILDINLNINDRRRDDQFQLLNAKLDKIMADTKEQWDAVLKRIDDATTAHAQNLKDIKEKLANAGLDKSVEQDIFSRLDSAAKNLEDIGKDPENPVPDETDHTEGGVDGGTEAPPAKKLPGF